jgi:hypothetical protein
MVMIPSSLFEQPSTSSTPIVQWPLPYARQDAETLHAQPNASRLGAAVAASICVAIGVYGWWGTSVGWFVGAVGLPGAVIMGWRLAPRVLAADRGGAVRVAGWMAIGTVLISDAVVAVVLAVGSAIGAITTASAEAGGLAGPEIAMLAASVIPTAVIFFAFGTIVALLALGSAFPAALVWTVIVRWLAGRGLAR